MSLCAHTKGVTGEPEQMADIGLKWKVATTSFRRRDSRSDAGDRRERRSEVEQRSALCKLAERPITSPVATRLAGLLKSCFGSGSLLSTSEGSFWDVWSNHRLSRWIRFTRAVDVDESPHWSWICSGAHHVGSSDPLARFSRVPASRKTPCRGDCCVFL